MLIEEWSLAKRVQRAASPTLDLRVTCLVPIPTRRWGHESCIMHILRPKPQKIRSRCQGQQSKRKAAWKVLAEQLNLTSLPVTQSHGQKNGISEEGQWNKSARASSQWRLRLFLKFYPLFLFPPWARTASIGTNNTPEFLQNKHDFSPIFNTSSTKVRGCNKFKTETAYLTFSFHADTSS